MPLTSRSLFVLDRMFHELDHSETGNISCKMSLIQGCMYNLCNSDTRKVNYLATERYNLVDRIDRLFPRLGWAENGRIAVMLGAKEAIEVKKTCRFTDDAVLLR